MANGQNGRQDGPGDADRRGSGQGGGERQQAPTHAAQIQQDRGMQKQDLDLKPADHTSGAQNNSEQNHSQPKEQEAERRVAGENRDAG